MNEEKIIPNKEMRCCYNCTKWHKANYIHCQCSGPFGGDLSNDKFCKFVNKHRKDKIMAKSKVAKMKEEMGWQKEHPCCGNCENFISTLIERKGSFGGFWTEEKNKRCEKGGFATSKSFWCKCHVFKTVGE